MRGKIASSPANAQSLQSVQGARSVSGRREGGMHTDLVGFSPLQGLLFEMKAPFLLIQISCTRTTIQFKIMFMVEADVAFSVAESHPSPTHPHRRRRQRQG